MQQTIESSLYSNANCSYLTPFGPNYNGNLGRPNCTPPFGELRARYMSKILPIEMSTLHSYSTSIHVICLSCNRLAIMQRLKQTDRQTYRQTTDRAIRISLLRSSIGGLNKFSILVGAKTATNLEWTFIGLVICLLFRPPMLA